MTRVMTPWAVLTECATADEVTKSAALARCRALEDEALADPPKIAVAVLQDARFVTDRTHDVWQQLAAAGTDLTIMARDLVQPLAPLVQARDLDDTHPLVDHWAFLVQWADGRAKAFVAIDAKPPQGRALDDMERPLLSVVCDDPDQAVRALEAAVACC